MNWRQLPLAPLYADVRTYCSHVNMYGKRVRLLSSHPRLFIHSRCLLHPTQSPPPPTPPISNCFHFLLGITVCTRETENNTCAKGFGGSCIISISIVLLLYFGSTGTYPPVRYANYTAPLYDGVYFIPVQNGNIEVLLPFLPPWCRNSVSSTHKAKCDDVNSKGLLMLLFHTWANYLAQQQTALYVGIPVPV